MHDDQEMKIIGELLLFRSPGKSDEPKKNQLDNPKKNVYILNIYRLIFGSSLFGSSLFGSSQWAINKTPLSVEAGEWKQRKRKIMFFPQIRNNKQLKNSFALTFPVRIQSNGKLLILWWRAEYHLPLSNIIVLERDWANVHFN